MRSVIFAVAVVGMFCFASICRAQQYDNPKFAAWSKFNIGSSQTLESVTGDGNKQVTTDQTRTLTEKTDDYLVVEMKSTMIMAGQSMEGAPHTEKIPAKLDKDTKETPAGEEKIDAAGKTYDCKVFTVTQPNALPGRPDSTVKMWVCADVPGGIVKMETSAFKGTVTWLLKSSETK